MAKQKKPRNKQHRKEPMVDRAVKHVINRMFIIDSSSTAQMTLVGMENCAAFGRHLAVEVEHRVLKVDGQRPLPWQIWVAIASENEDGSVDVDTRAFKDLPRSSSNELGTVIADLVQEFADEVQSDTTYGLAWGAYCGRKDIMEREDNFMTYLEKRDFLNPAAARLNFLNRVSKVAPERLSEINTGKAIDVKTICSLLKASEEINDAADESNQST